MREGTKLTGWLSALPQYGVLDVYSWFPRLAAPTRILHLAAEFDHYVTHARQRRLFDQLAPDVRQRSLFLTIARAAHDANPFHDATLTDVLLQFLAEH